MSMEPKAEAFANRDHPVQFLQVPYEDVDASSSDPETPSRAGSRSYSKQKGMVRDAASPLSPNTRQSLQDRMFNKLFSQVIPTEELNEPDEDNADYNPQGIKKPDFSLTVMGNNFRRFNARIGVVFVFQNRMVKLFSWRRPTHTLSFLAVYTFLCLDPYLIIALPLAVALLAIMVPAFLSRHPPPPPPPVASALVQDHTHSAYSYSGPAIAPAKTIKPAPETSKDFFRNMRDLQNSMADFSDAHDALVSTIAPATNFSNEVLSSTIFLYLTIATTILFISAHLIPFRLVFLLGGYAMIVSGHPQVQVWLIKQQKRAEKRAAQSSQSPSIGDQQSSVIVAGLPVSLPSNKIARKVQSTISTMSEITLSTTPDTREVEIFELQHRPILPATLSHSSETAEIYEWTPHLFTPAPFDPLSPARIAGERPKGTRFFEDVQPPPGWEWSSKKWQLDFEAGEWVSERLIMGVEYDQIHDVEIDDTQRSVNAPTATENVSPDTTNQVIGEDFAAQRKRKQSVNLDFGGWVWDLPPAVGSTGNRDEEVWLAYGDYDIPSLSYEDQKRKEKEKESKKGHKKSSSSKTHNVHQDKDWEEQVTFGKKERTGEWRRRRWVRVVKRKALNADGH